MKYGFGVKLTPPPLPEKTTLKKPNLIRDNLSKSNNQYAVVHQVVTHKTVSILEINKPFSLSSCDLTRPAIASKCVCNDPSQPAKCKATSKPVFNALSKPVKLFVNLLVTSSVKSEFVKSLANYLNSLENLLVIS